MRIICLFLFICLSTANLIAGESITMLDGSSKGGAVESISADGVVTTASGETFNLSDIRSIHSAAKPVPRPDSPRLYLRHGGMIAAKSVVLGQNICRADWIVRIAVPASAVSAIELSSAKKGRDAFKRAFSTVLEKDQIIALSDTGARVLKGIVLSLNKLHLELKYKEKVRKIALAKVYGVVLAGKAPVSKGICRTFFADGSWLANSKVVLADGTLSLSMVEQEEVKVPWQSVARIAVTSDRLVFLSDLEPVSVTQEAIVTFPATWQRDKSVLGREMRLGDRVFEKGIGVHSLSRLVFAGNGEYSAFAAVIGIDAETGGKGDCIFRVIGDGKQLYEKRMRGSDKSVPIRLNIKGVKQLTLEVSPGENLDLADHGNWGDARFLK